MNILNMAERTAVWCVLSVVLGRRFCLVLAVVWIKQGSNIKMDLESSCLLGLHHPPIMIHDPSIAG